MKKAYLGVDIGSISTKGVIIDENNNILASTYQETNADPINATKKVLKSLEQEFDKNYKIVGVGTTGSARKLIGKMLGANIVKNEITAHATGTLSKYPNVRTILEIGGQDSKIILLKNKIVTDYAMNTLCAAGCGAFLTSQAKRLNIPITDFGKIALTSKNPTPIAARCTVFAESDLIHKAQAGYKKEDIIAGLCNSIVLNYLNNVAKGKKIASPIVFQGGVSKNIGVKHFFEENLKEKVIVDKDSHLLGCLGIAILSKKEKEINFSFDINNFTFKSYETTCKRCPNRCEIISIKKDNKLIDSWGNRCEKGTLKV